MIVKKEVAGLAIEFLDEMARPQRERRDYTRLIKRDGRYWVAAICRPEYLEKLKNLHGRIRALNGRGYNATRQPYELPTWAESYWGGKPIKTAREPTVHREELERLKARAVDLRSNGMYVREIAALLEIPYGRADRYVKGVPRGKPKPWEPNGADAWLKQHGKLG